MKYVKQTILLVVSILILGTSSISAEEILLAKYDFSTKSTVPVNKAPGVTFGSEFAVWNPALIYPMEMSITDDGYLLVRGYSASVAHNRYGYISITPEDGKTIRITKVIVNHYKEPGSNTAKTRCYLYDTGGNQPIDNPKVLADLIYLGTGGLSIPATLTEETIIPTVEADISSVKFMSFYSTQVTPNIADLAQWKIRSLTFYGEIIVPGDIVVSKAIDFGIVLKGNIADKSATMKVVGGISKNVGLELIDPDGAFSCMQTEIEAVDATAGTTIRVSYNPTKPGTHTAQLKFKYDNKVSYTKLSGVCPVLYESFTQYISDPITWAEMNGKIVNSYTQDGIFAAQGWKFNDGLYWHLSGSYGLGLELRGTNNEPPKATTPELDLSAPFGISFRSKKTVDRKTLLGDLFVMVDSDTIFSIVNPNSVLNLRSAIGFIGKANSKISFVGIANDSNRIAIDEISIFPTNTPTLTLPSYSTRTVNGIVKPVIFDFPFRAYQLTSDITVTLTGTPAGYEVLTPTFTKAAAEAGATLQVKFTPPAGGIAENAELKVQGGGLSSIRIIKFKASTATGLIENKINAKIYPKKGLIYASIEGVSTLEIYSYDGKIVCKKQITGNAEVAVRSGLYIVRVKNTAGCRVEKVLVK